jgi:predicted ATPase
MPYNVTTVTCGSSGSVSGIAGMMLGGLLTSLVRSGCDVADTSFYPPDKGYVPITDARNLRRGCVQVVSGSVNTHMVVYGN